MWGLCQKTSILKVRQASNKFSLFAKITQVRGSFSYFLDFSLTWEKIPPACFRSAALCVWLAAPRAIKELPVFSLAWGDGGNTTMATDILQDASSSASFCPAREKGLSYREKKKPKMKFLSWIKNGHKFFLFMNASLIFMAQYSSVWSPDVGMEGDMEGTWLNAKIFSY